MLDARGKFDQGHGLAIRPVLAASFLPWLQLQLQLHVLKLVPLVVEALGIKTDARVVGLSVRWVKRWSFGGRSVVLCCARKVITS